MKFLILIIGLSSIQSFAKSHKDKIEPNPQEAEIDRVAREGID